MNDQRQRRARQRGIAALCLPLFFCHAFARPAERTVTPADVVPGVIVVRVAPGSSLQHELAAGTVTALAPLGVRWAERVAPATPMLRRAGNHEHRDLLDRLYLLHIGDDRDPVAAAARLSAAPDVEYAEPKFMHRLARSPNDPALLNQTGPFLQMALLDAWGIATGSRDVVVAVIDGGTYWPHEDLEGNLWINGPEDLNGNGRFDPGDEDGVDQDGNGFVDDVIGWNFAAGSNDPRGLAVTPQSHSHGTATASHFGAVTDNGIGMAGTAWNATLLPVCASSPSGDNLIAYGYEGILYAAAQGAAVINCSWGRLGGLSLFEQDVIAIATSLGALVVAATGNTSTDIDLRPHYPSSYEGVLSVGATNSTNDQKAAFSNYGANASVFAPGVNIWSALTNGLYGPAGSGTSFSSSLVAGVAGLLRSHRPSWSPEQIAAQIRVTADPIESANPGLVGKLGRGRVNALRALTESRPGVQLAAAEFATANGGKIFLVGDTVRASIRLKNVLFTAAGQTSVQLTSSDPVLEVIGGSAIVGAIQPGEELALPPILLRVAQTGSSREVPLRLEWTVSGESSDARVFLLTVFPSLPLWALQESETGIPLFSVKAVSAQVAWAAGGNSLGTSPVVLRTTDGGGRWERVTGDLPDADFYCITATDAERAWAGTGDGRIFATGDGGGTWTEQPYPDPQSPFINGIWFVDPLHGFAQGDPPPGSTRFVVLRTTDGGTSWLHVPNAPVGGTGEYGWNNSFWWTDATHGWFGTNSNRIWRTTDGGTTWSSAPGGATSSFGVAFTSPLVGFAAHGDGTVARTTDGGQSWVNGPIGAGTGLVGAAAIPGGLRAWVASGGTPFETADLGATWTGQTTYPFSGDIAHLSFGAPDRGWAVTSAGEILRYDPTIADVGGTETDARPATSVLAQNYPNPFNPTTTIEYDLPTAAAVRLVVVDLLGRSVRTLLDETRSAGSHRVRFDARGLSSGIYFYSILAQPTNGGAPFRQIRPMVLTR